MSGIPKLRKRPLREREEAKCRKGPSTGSNRLITPKDGAVMEMVTRPVVMESPYARHAKRLGWGAVATVVVFWGLILYISGASGLGLPIHKGTVTLLVILLMGLVHVLAIASQIASNGKNLPGSLSLLGFYFGSIVMFAVGHAIWY